MFDRFKKHDEEMDENLESETIEVESKEDIRLWDGASPDEDPLEPSRLGEEMALGVTHCGFASADKLCSAFSSPGFLSGWYFMATLRYAFLRADSSTPLSTPRTS